MASSLPAIGGGRSISNTENHQQLTWRRVNGEWWIGTTTIEMAKIKFLKTKIAFI